MRGGDHRCGGGGTWGGWSNCGRGGIGAGAWLAAPLPADSSTPGAGDQGTAFGCPACGGGPNEGWAAGAGGGPNEGWAVGAGGGPGSG